MNAGVVIYSMSDIPLGFGVSVRTTAQCRDIDPTAMVALHVVDVGDYIRDEEHIV